MAKTIGTDSTVLARETSSAVRADFALLAASASTRPRARCWFGQMTNQTLNHMMAPSHMPMPIMLCLATTSMRPDRKSVVEGKSVSVRLDLGGGSIIKKKKKQP